MFKAYGIDSQEFVKLYNSSPLLRSGAAQRIFHDLAILYSSRQAAQRPVAPVPRVMKPGAASDRVSGESAAMANLARQFAADPNPRNAAKLLSAKRRAAAAR